MGELRMDESVDVDREVQRLEGLRQDFWDRVKAEDREGAEQVQKTVHEYPNTLDFDINDFPPIEESWGEISEEVDIPLVFMKKGKTPEVVWEAKAEINRIGEQLRALRDESLREEDILAHLDEAGPLVDEMKSYYMSLDPALRRHPILLKAMSYKTYGFATTSDDSSPGLSDEERADLKRRRMHHWALQQKRILYLARLTPPSIEEAKEWFANFLTTEQRVEELVESVGERFVTLYWELDEQHAALLLVSGVDSEGGQEDIANALAASGLFTVERSTRIYTTDELWIANTPSFPGNDVWREGDMDEEELDAYRRFRRRREEETRAILATTPCHVCGRFVDPGESYSINRVAKGSSLVEDDGTVLVEGPAVLVYCPDHRGGQRRNRQQG